MCTINDITWCMVPEIWSETNIIFCHFGPFFALFPPYQPRKSKFWKNGKNDLKYHHFTQLYHKWKYEYCMIYGSWDMECNRIFHHFGPSFAPLTTPKIKISKKKKKYLEISSFYTSVPKIMFICYTVPQIWCMMDVIFIFHFGLFFALLPP